MSNPDFSDSSFFRFGGRSIAAFPLIMTLCLFSLNSKAQDDAFLRCADFADRGARIACLEDALEAAVAARSARTNQPQPPAVAQQPPAQAPVAPAAPALAVPARDPSAAPKEEEREEQGGFALFGFFDRAREERQAREEQQKSETMQAKVADLSFYKPDVLTITLDNGQVWRQIYVRRYNLREGDAVNIYQPGWGEQFRLEAERFNGFIQVERLR